MDTTSFSPFDSPEQPSRRYGFWLWFFYLFMAPNRLIWGYFAAILNFALLLRGLSYFALFLPTDSYSAHFLLGVRFNPLYLQPEFYIQWVVATGVWGLGWLVRNRFWQRSDNFPWQARLYMVVLAGAFLFEWCFMFYLERKAAAAGFDNEVFRQMQKSETNDTLKAIGWSVFYLCTLAGWSVYLQKLVASGRTGRVFWRNLEKE